jgi:hypothetical protein
MRPFVIVGPADVAGRGGGALGGPVIGDMYLYSPSSPPALPPMLVPTYPYEPFFKGAVTIVLYCDDELGLDLEIGTGPSAAAKP